MIELIPSSLLHVGPIAARMRENDRIECKALGRTPKEALRMGLRTSQEPLTAIFDGRPIAMLGVMPVSLVRGLGSPWMLGTDEVYSSGRALLKLGPRVVAAMRHDFRELENIVSAQNTRAIRFLARAGFMVGGAVQIHRGVEFVPFRMGAIQAFRPRQ